MLSIIIILSIALAIFLGYRTKINTGLFCIVFAYWFLAYKYHVCYLICFIIL